MTVGRFGGLSAPTVMIWQAVGSPFILGQHTGLETPVSSQKIRKKSRTFNFLCVSAPRDLLVSHSKVTSYAGSKDGVYRLRGTGGERARWAGCQVFPLVFVERWTL